ncbi:MAG: putative selenium-dependent hydroxylase accessory protein YqeC [Lachnospiraceae bacterium]|nr:putative selenium-dependent hydroxylase accessory protein YqeC [Lachnospiraceae bacterium]
MALALPELLQIEKGLTAFIGSGGKSALMLRLAHALPGTVLICSTYYYYPYENTAFLSRSHVDERTEEDMLSFLLKENRVVCAGEMVGNGKLGRPVSSFSRLKALADYILVEADDAKGLPLKAHEKREPALPEDADRVISVIGALGFMRPVSESVHHPEIFRLLTGCAEDALARPELVARAHLNEKLTQNVFVNQVESRAHLVYAEGFVNATDYKNVIVGSVKNNAYKRYA